MIIHGIEFHSTLFLSIALVDRTIHLSVFTVSSIIFGFCIISYAEFKSCLLTPFKGFILVLKPYIVFFAFIFEKWYWIRILSSILCTLGTMYVYIYIRTYICRCPAEFIIHSYMYVCMYIRTVPLISNFTLVIAWLNVPYMFHMNLASSFPELMSSFPGLASSLPELARAF